MYKFGKNWLGLLRNADGADGGGTGAADAAAVTEQAVSPEASAGAEGDTPAATFISEAKAGEPPAEGETKAVEGAGETPAAFDLATVKLPEGVELDAEVGKAFSDLLGNAELSPQERGQQLLDLHVKALADVQKASADAMAEESKATWTRMNDEWRGQIKDLPEFKENPDAEAGKVLQALKAVGADEKFFQAMDLTGAGNHPAVLQVLHRLAKPFMEGGSVSGNGKAMSSRRLGDNIYTSTQPKE